MVPLLSDRDELVDLLSQHPEAIAFSWGGDDDLLGDRGPGDEGVLLGRAYVVGEGGEVNVAAAG